MARRSLYTPLVSYELFENGWRVSDDRALLDMEAVHRWLAGSYWTPGISREQVERQTTCSSYVFGAYAAEAGSDLAAAQQVAFARVLSDSIRFAYVCDVIVDPAQRGHGIGKLLMRGIMEHPELCAVRRWLLATRDAHTLYEQFGFGALPKPEMWMQLKRSDDDGPVWR